MNIFICSHNKYIRGCTAIGSIKTLIPTKNYSKKAENNWIKFHPHFLRWTVWKKLKINTNPNIIDGNHWEITSRICRLRIATKDLFPSRNINPKSKNNKVLSFKETKHQRFIQMFKAAFLERLKVLRIVEKRFINLTIGRLQVDHHFHFQEIPKKSNCHSNPTKYPKETKKRCLEAR